MLTLIELILWKTDLNCNHCKEENETRCLINIGQLWVGVVTEGPKDPAVPKLGKHCRQKTV